MPASIAAAGLEAVGSAECGFPPASSGITACEVFGSQGAVSLDEISAMLVAEYCFDGSSSCEQRPIS